MRGIGTSDKEGLLAVHTVLVFNGVGFGFIANTLAQGLLYVRHETALASLGKLLADESIEAYAAGTEKRFVAHRAVVKGAHFAFVDNADSTLDIDRNVLVASQSIARTARDDGKHRLRIHQCACHFVDSTVTAHSYNHVHPIGCCLTGEFVGMARIFRCAKFGHIFLLIQFLKDKIGNILLGAGASYWVDYKGYSLHGQKC